MSDTLKIHVGTLTLTQKHVQRVSYECAAWYRDVEIAPGAYPIYAFAYWIDGGHKIHQLSAICEGITVAGDFTPLFGGNPIAKSRDVRGEPATATIALPTYGALSDVPGELTSIALSGETHAEVRLFDGIFTKLVWSPKLWNKDEVGPAAPVWSLRFDGGVKIKRKAVQDGPRYSGSTWDAEIVAV